MKQMIELAERAEKATGPDRELDAAIAGTFSNSVESDDGDYWWGPYDEPPQRVPEFTASLDAAMQLVPEGHRWGVVPRDTENPNRQWVGELRRGHWTSYDKAFVGYAATPALALCAAALRATAAMKKDDGE